VGGLQLKSVFDPGSVTAQAQLEDMLVPA
jgi:hypothetical protein